MCLIEASTFEVLITRGLIFIVCFVFYRFLKMEDRKRALVSRLLQNALVHEVLGIPVDEIIIKRTIEGKPYLV